MPQAALLRVLSGPRRLSTVTEIRIMNAANTAVAAGAYWTMREGLRRSRSGISRCDMRRLKLVSAAWSLGSEPRSARSIWLSRRCALRQKPIRLPPGGARLEAARHGPRWHGLISSGYG